MKLSQDVNPTWRVWCLATLLIPLLPTRLDSLFFFLFLSIFSFSSSISICLVYSCVWHLTPPCCPFSLCIFSIFFSFFLSLFFSLFFFLSFSISLSFFPFLSFPLSLSLFLIFLFHCKKINYSSQYSVSVFVLYRTCLG